MESKNQIQVYWTQDGYMAHFVGDHAESVIKALGTDTIPTAFTAQANPETVLEALRKLNPNADVCFAGFGGNYRRKEGE